jgi:asparagine synthase (glutamine-hydrolysing)
MNDIQGHRGPNGKGIYIDKGIALGHARLSILDLSDAGAQPMYFEQFVLVYNGEIYNFKAVRAKLQSQGYRFNSHSDTEVLIKAWHCWGEACLHEIEGMFAFALLDKNQNNLYLCRDSYGVKPLYYTLLNDEFIFASELTTVVRALDSKPVVDKDAVASFLALHFIPAPATGWEGIYKLPPGNTLVIDFREGSASRKTIKAWGDTFKPSFQAASAGLSDIDEVLANATQKQMVSDVPVGAFLSGGVDSSLICHYASVIKADRLHTFSIGFTDAGLEHDETLYAKRASQVLHTIHHPIQVELASISDRVSSILDRLGELNADTSVILNDIICEEASKHVTVCLSGAGGDELFAGYFRHQALIAAKYLRFIPEAVSTGIQDVLSRLPQHRDSAIGNFTRRLNHFLNQRKADGNFVSMLRNDYLFPQHSVFLHENIIKGIAEALAFDFRYYLCDNIFSFTDKISMLHSLEVRVPFLDPEVIRIAESLNLNQLVTAREKKIILKKLAVKYFPRNIIYRKKKGFSAPIDIWLRNHTKTELINMCLDGVAVDFLDQSLIVDMAAKFLIDRLDFSSQLYSLIVLNNWAREAG